VIPPRPRPHTCRAVPTLLATLSLLGHGNPTPLAAQAPVPGEVRQLVTFRFLPGRAGDAMRIFAERAVPLYEENEAMRSFRGLREVESPVPLDLVVVSAFDGMAGMDASNEALGRLAAAAGTSIGAIYGGIAALSDRHDDQFLEMVPELGSGDPMVERLVALIWYRTLPGEEERFERTLAGVVEWERGEGIPAATGRFLISDGWTHLRFLGFASLAEYQAYWDGVDASRERSYLSGVVALQREAILAPVPELAVR
jgi:hypothetical protein